MQARPLGRHSGGAVLALIASLLLGSCTSTVTDIDTAAQTVQPQFASQTETPATEAQGSAAASETATAPKLLPAQTAAAAPDAKSSEVAAAPAVPGTDTQTQLTAAATQTAADAALPAPAKAGDPAASQTANQQVAAVAAETIASPQPLVVINEPNAPAATAQPDTAAAPAATAAKGAKAAAPETGKAIAETAAPSLTAAEPAAPAPAKKQRKTLFAAMFGDTQQKQSPAAVAAEELAEPKTTELALAAAPAIRPAVAKAAATELDTPQLKLTQASLSQTPAEEPQSAPSVDNGDLPGVRKGALFEIKRRDSLDSDADIDIGETDGGPVLLASAGGFARLAPNGLKVQRQSVDVACLKPQLVRMLKKIEAHYGQSVVVTSGYRSPNYNRRVRGAKNSLHMYCAAADIQVAGVGKWELARYLRSMPGRGGVGTYCHTNSLHVDIGPDRDWNWRCSRRK